MAGLLEHATTQDPGELRGRPVVTLGGDDIAAIHEPIEDGGEVTAFSLEKRTLFGGLMDRTLPLDAVLAIGDDAVVVTDASVLVGGEEDDGDEIGPAMRTGPGDRTHGDAAEPALLSSVRGLPVVSVDTGEQVGRVDRMILDPVTGTVMSLRLDNTASSGRFLSWRQLARFGEDSLEVAAGELLRKPDGPREEGCRSTFRTRGKPVLADDGVLLGEIADVEFDRADGRVTALVLGDDARVDGGRIRGLGPHAIVVSA